MFPRVPLPHFTSEKNLHTLTYSRSHVGDSPTGLICRLFFTFRNVMKWNKNDKTHLKYLFPTPLLKYEKRLNIATYIPWFIQYPWFPYFWIISKSNTYTLILDLYQLGICQYHSCLISQMLKEIFQRDLTEPWTWKINQRRVTVFLIGDRVYVENSTYNYSNIKTFKMRKKPHIADRII